ncbi:MAG: nitroreductase family protein [Magnetococcales bacterium]|nr:nitroreductase family protein [Magnetococcales bacterium]
MNAIERIVAYHQRTKHHPRRYAAGPGYMDWENQPDPFRRFSDSSSIDLPLAADQLKTLYADLDHSESITPQPMDLQGVASLFELALAISAWKSYMGERWAVRCNPSSGNLHPTEGYLISPDGVGPGAGIWHYEGEFHRLELRGEVAEPAWSDAFPPEQFCIALSTIHGRESWKYGERAFRYCQLNLGHAAMAFRVAAAALGWRATLTDGLGDDDLIRLLGLEPWPLPLPPEQERPGLLLTLSSNAADTPLSEPLEEALRNRSESIVWRGQASRLTTEPLREWTAIRHAHEAAIKPALPLQTSTPPESPHPLACASRLRAADLIRQRRSAVRYDNRSSIPMPTFFRILDALIPRPGVSPWDLFTDTTRIHPLLMVHRVQGVTPGLYVLIRNPAVLDDLKQALRPDFLWKSVQEAPDHLPLYRLSVGDEHDFARMVSCNQDIAADGAFSLGMLAEFDSSLTGGAWIYRRLHEEAGAVGQILYLEAEAAGYQGTGIGCFFDDLFHTRLGIEALRFQTLYHFTIGTGIADNRLETAPPFAHLSR